MGAFVVMGLVAIRADRDIFNMFSSPSDFVGKYLWLVLVVVVFVLFYILLITTLGLYVFSGSAGVVGRACWVAQVSGPGQKCHSTPAW